MITLETDRLVFRFPDVHEDASCSIEFQRTLRIPDDDEIYPLPPGLGCFPLRHLDDFAKRLPPRWLSRGGVIMPMYQAEAMWLNFEGGFRRKSYPCAVKIATGKINAVTGEPWSNGLNQDPQDYVVIPEQPWLDGYCVEKGQIRQFVAMPLGDGYSVEEQVTGDAEHGGVQIIVYPMKAERYEALQRKHEVRLFHLEEPQPCMSEPAPDMGLAPGGRMTQEIYEDSYGLDAWDQRHSSRCFITIANSVLWSAVTGETPPTKAPMADQYTKAGLPWFDYYDESQTALGGADTLSAVLSVSDMGKKKGKAPLPENNSVDVDTIIKLRDRRSNQVREYDHIQM